MFPSLKLAAALLALVGATSASAAELEPLDYCEGSGFAEAEVRLHETSRDTFYFVDVFATLQSFATLNDSLTAARGSSAEGRVLLTDENLYRQYASVVSSIAQSHWRSSSASNSFSVAQVRMLGKDFYDPYELGFYHYASQQQYMTLREARVRVETMVCTIFSTAFPTVVMDRNGGEWLFSDAFEDEDAAAIDRAIDRELEAAHEATRFHCAVHFSRLLPLFDRFYERCVGRKLDAFRRHLNK